MEPSVLAETGFDISTVTSAVTSSLSSLSPANVVTVIGAGLAIAVPLVLTWFAFRWVYAKAKGALKRGK